MNSKPRNKDFILFFDKLTSYLRIYLILCCQFSKNYSTFISRDSQLYLLLMKNDIQQ